MIALYGVSIHLLRRGRVGETARPFANFGGPRGGSKGERLRRSVIRPRGRYPASGRTTALVTLSMWMHFALPPRSTSASTAL